MIHLLGASATMSTSAYFCKAERRQDNLLDRETPLRKPQHQEQPFPWWWIFQTE